MWVLFPRRDGDEVLYRSFKHTHIGGHFCGKIWGVPVLERINVIGTIFPNIASNQPLNGFDPHLSSAVAVWEWYGAQAVVYSPLV